MTPLSDGDDDLPLDALLAKKDLVPIESNPILNPIQNNENNNGNKESDQPIIPLADPDALPPVIPYADPDAPDPNAESDVEPDAEKLDSDTDTGTSVTTSSVSVDAQTLMDEIRAEKRKRADEHRRKANEQRRKKIEQLKAATVEEVIKDINDRREVSKSPARDSASPEPIPDNTLLGAITGAGHMTGKRGSFVLRKDKNDDDDMSVSDMDCSDDEGNKTNIEMNVKIPAFAPRIINRAKTRQTRPTRGRTVSQVGPRRVSPGRFQPAAAAAGPATGLVAPIDIVRPLLRQPPPHIIAQQKAALISNKIQDKNHVGNSKQNNTAQLDEECNEEDYGPNMPPQLGPVPDKYNLPDLQSALEEVQKELGRYKLTTELKNEGTYWLTLVKEGVPRWGLVDAIKDFYEPFVIPESCPQEEKLNDAAMTEIMSDLKKKAVAEQVEGVGAWKSRQKVNKMFLARTIKNQMMTELMFEKQKKEKQIKETQIKEKQIKETQLNADRVADEKQQEKKKKQEKKQDSKQEKKKKSKKRRKSTSSSSSSSSSSDEESDHDKSGDSDLEIIGEDLGVDAKVGFLPIPSDVPKEERVLTERAVQELMREASAFIKGRSARKKINQGYELGANLNADGSIKQKQTFVSSQQQLGGFGPASNVPEWRASAPGVILGELQNSGEKTGEKKLGVASNHPSHSGYMSEVIKLANCQFSDALLGYSWTHDGHWKVPNSTSVKKRKKAETKRLTGSHKYRY